MNKKFLQILGIVILVAAGVFWFTRPKEIDALTFERVDSDREKEAIAIVEKAYVEYKTSGLNAALPLIHPMDSASLNDLETALKECKSPEFSKAEAKMSKTSKDTYFIYVRDSGDKILFCLANLKGKWLLSSCNKLKK